jgi:hypothetical protein
MKSNGTLQKHYDKLTPRERMALLLGSIARAFAFTFDETCAELLKSFGDNAEPITVERALADLREVFNEFGARE